MRFDKFLRSISDNKEEAVVLDGITKKEEVDGIHILEKRSGGRPRKPDHLLSRPRIKDNPRYNKYGRVKARYLKRRYGGSKHHKVKAKKPKSKTPTRVDIYYHYIKAIVIHSQSVPWTITKKQWLALWRTPILWKNPRTCLKEWRSAWDLRRNYGGKKIQLRRRNSSLGYSLDNIVLFYMTKGNKKRILFPYPGTYPEPKINK